MRELLRRIWKKDEGFSLIELIIVIAILAIIAAIAVPNLINNINNSRKTTDVANAKLIADSVAAAIANNPTLQVDKTDEAFTAASTDATIIEARGVFSGTIPTPQYLPGTYGANFTVTIVAATGAITVETASGAELYPNVAATHKND